MAERLPSNGIPQCLSGWYSMFSLLRVWVPSLIGELRSRKPHRVAKKERKKEKKTNQPEQQNPF